MTEIKMSSYCLDSVAVPQRALCVVLCVLRLTGLMDAGRLGSLMSFTIFIISSKLYFKNGPSYPGVGINPSSAEVWEF